MEKIIIYFAIGLEFWTMHLKNDKKPIIIVHFKWETSYYNEYNIQDEMRWS